MTNQIQPVILKKKQAAAMCGISISTLDRLRADGDFARPIKLGVQAIGFMRTDLDKWIASRMVLMHYSTHVEF